MTTVIKTVAFPTVQLILEGGYGALGQGDGACDRRKQDEEKEQDPCACSNPMPANTFGSVMNARGGKVEKPGEYPGRRRRRQRRPE